MSLLDNIPPQVQTLRMSQECRRLYVIQALECRRLRRYDHMRDFLYYAKTEKLNIKYFMPNGNEPF
ncbi:hypothetical protein SODG_004994 [Sodalis praecaptivus]|nr:hypothetical protein NVIRENTERO_02373 [Sodalis praecaptivus]